MDSLNALKERMRNCLIDLLSPLFRDVVKFDTNVHIVLTGPDGKVKEERRFHNLITTAGKRKLLLASSANQLNAFAYCAIGTSSTAANAADTTLGTEIARSSVITPTNSPDADHLQFQTTFAAGTGTGTIVESGLLDAASAGTLLCHQVFGAITKGSGDSLQITWSIS